VARTDRKIAEVALQRLAFVGANKADSQCPAVAKPEVVGVARVFKKTDRGHGGLHQIGKNKAGVP
jgi:hypothetical protein